MAVLVTGGAGYIGRWLARELTGQGVQVTAVDRVAPEPGGTLPMPAEVEFVQGDVGDRDLLIRTLQAKQYDAVIHLAGIVTMGAERDPDLAMRVNLDGTRNALEAARLAAVPRFVLASTISVYGPNVPQPLTEDTPAEPLTWYGQSKIMAENLGLYYQRRWGLDFRAARLAAIVGPFRNAASGSATMYTSLIIEKPALGEPYFIDVDEGAATPVCYAKDAARALATLATVEAAPSRIYNIGTARASAVQLVDIVKRLIPGAQLEFRPETNLAAVGRISWKWDLSIKRAEEELGWKPLLPLEGMVEDIIAIARGERTI